MLSARPKMPQVHLRSAIRDKYIVQALCAELLGVFLFQVLAGTVSDKPIVSALVLTSLMYATKDVSGGHLNPAVSLAAALSGHIDWTRGILYIVAQVLGGVLGAMWQVVLGPGASFGKLSPGCIAPSDDLLRGELFGWETMLTFLFIWVVYSAIFIRPGHGDAAPLAAGITLAAALYTGGKFTGHSPLNPARSLAASIVFNCNWNWYWIYAAAHLTAVVAAAGSVLIVHGRGQYYSQGQLSAPHQGATEALQERLMETPGEV